MMNEDLNQFLDGWEFDPEMPLARKVLAADGRTMIQLRVDMGVLQMEVKGRPDGTRPKGCESLLEYYSQLEKQGQLPETLDGRACSELLRECMQYCARVQAFQALSDWVREYDDCEHVLDLVDLVSDLAVSDEDAWRADQLYPGIRVAHAMSAANLAREGARISRARTILEQAIADIERFYRETRDDDADEGLGNGFDGAPVPGEIQTLRYLLDEVEEERPKSREENLKKDLARALAREDYERAAAIRDQLKDLRTPPTRSGTGGKGKPRKASPPSDSSGGTA